MRKSNIKISAALLLPVLSFLWSAGTDDDFHKQSLNRYCATCHVCDQPTKEDPCLLDCPRHEGHFEGRHQITEGPEIVIMDHLANLYKPVFFTHKLHAEMSDMSGGCELCHHFSEPDKPVPPCRECHDATGDSISIQKPSLKAAYHRQCLNCHREWSHESECNICHEVADDASGKTAAVDKSDIMGMTHHPKIVAEEKYIYHTHLQDGPVVTFHHTDHVDLFGLQCVDCHQGDGCRKCHEEHINPTEKTMAVDDCALCRNSCCKCHVANCNSEQECGFCHSMEEKPAFDHAVSVGWPLSPRHDGVSCESCHGSVKDFSSPSVNCTSCHIHWLAGSFDHGVTGLILSEDHEDLDCSDCHIDEDFGEPPSCEGCHESDEAEYPDDLPGWRE